VWASRAPKLLSDHTFFNATPWTKEGSVPLPQCNRCGLQILYKAINGRHYETALCKDGVVRKVQHAAAECVHLALQNTFTLYGKGLERVEVFKYPGFLLAYNNNDSQAVHGNLKKHEASGQGSHTR
jgi:hypothetical protein